MCAACGAAASRKHVLKLLKCACNAASYCNRTCQARHWSEHKTTCKASREASDPAAAAERERNDSCVPNITIPDFGSLFGPAATYRHGGPSPDAKSTDPGILLCLHAQAPCGCLQHHGAVERAQAQGRMEKCHGCEAQKPQTQLLRCAGFKQVWYCNVSEMPARRLEES